jgi:hypothetical protein
MRKCALLMGLVLLVAGCGSGGGPVVKPGTDDPWAMNEYSLALVRDGRYREASLYALENAVGSDGEPIPEEQKKQHAEAFIVQVQEYWEKEPLISWEVVEKNVSENEASFKTRYKRKRGESFYEDEEDLTFMKKDGRWWFKF